MDKRIDITTSATVAAAVRREAKGHKGGVSAALKTRLAARTCGRLGNPHGRARLTFFVTLREYAQLKRLGAGNAGDGAKFVLTGHARIPCTVDEIHGRYLAAKAKPWAKFRGEKG